MNEFGSPTICRFLNLTIGFFSFNNFVRFSRSFEVVYFFSRTITRAISLNRISVSLCSFVVNSKYRSAFTELTNEITSAVDTYLVCFSTPSTIPTSIIGIVIFVVF